MPIPLGILAVAGAGVGVASDFDLLETTVLSSSAASVTFSNLGDYSSTYKHLQIRATVRVGTSTEIDLRINSDSGSNYSMHNLRGNGSSVSSYGETNTTYIQTGVAGATANIFSALVIDVLDAFSTSKNKTIRSLSGEKGGFTSNGFIELWSGAWRNTNSITSLQLYGRNSSSLQTGCRISLYGIKG